MGLPDHVAQEDASHAAFERVFQAMDVDENRAITFEEFSNHIAHSNATTKKALASSKPTKPTKSTWMAQADRVAPPSSTRIDADASYRLGRRVLSPTKRGAAAEKPGPEPEESSMSYSEDEDQRLQLMNAPQQKEQPPSPPVPSPSPPVPASSETAAAAVAAMAPVAPEPIATAQTPVSLPASEPAPTPGSDAWGRTRNLVRTGLVAPTPSARARPTPTPSSTTTRATDAAASQYPPEPPSMLFYENSPGSRVHSVYDYPSPRNVNDAIKEAVAEVRNLVQMQATVQNLEARVKEVEEIARSPEPAPPPQPAPAPQPAPQPAPAPAPQLTASKAHLTGMMAQWEARLVRVESRNTVLETDLRAARADANEKERLRAELEIALVTSQTQLRELIQREQMGRTAVTQACEAMEQKFGSQLSDVEERLLASQTQMNDTLAERVYEADRYVVHPPVCVVGLWEYHLYH